MLNYQDRRKNGLFIKVYHLAPSLVCFVHLLLTCLLIAHYLFDNPFKTDNTFKLSRKRNRIRIDKNSIR